MSPSTPTARARTRSRSPSPPAAVCVDAVAVQLLQQGVVSPVCDTLRGDALRGAGDTLLVVLKVDARDKTDSQLGVHPLGAPQRGAPAAGGRQHRLGMEPVRGRRGQLPFGRGCPCVRASCARMHRVCVLADGT